MRKIWIAVGLILIIIISFINYNIYEELNSESIEQKIKKLDDAYYKYYHEKPKPIKKSKDLSLRDIYNLKTEQYLNLLSKDIIDLDNKIKLYRLENTTNFTDINRNAYNKILDSLIADYSLLLNYVKGKNYSSSANQVNILKNRIHDLSLILNNELANNNEIMKVYDLAVQNKIGTNKLIDDCFEKQEFSWQFDKSKSKEYCDLLGLNGCSNDKFIGYTMNNPKTVNNKLPHYSYVSFSPNDYKKDVINFDKYNNKYDFKVEVYSNEINKRIIYKYNIIGIPKDYKLNCLKP